MTRRSTNMRTPATLLGGLLVLLSLVLGLTATVLAQAPLNVIITDVDSSAFPQTTAYVTVTDAQGRALADLLPELFTLTEDGQTIPDFTVDSVANLGEPIHLVLALDTSGSMAGSPLRSTQTAAAQLIRDLGPADEVALLAFGESVVTALDFTTDRQAAVAAVEALSAAGDTALNDAVYGAAELLAVRPAGRRALVLLTDGDDTASVASLEEALRAVQAARFPVYAIGFGGVDRSVLNQLATATGGQFYEAPAVSDLADSFETVADLLRQQYVLRFASGLPADDAEHTLAVRVELEALAASDEASLLAGSRPIAVRLLNPVEGETVGGLVTLRPAIDAPAEVAEVTYLLDGALLATTNTGDFSYVWDTTGVPLGPHTLSVSAVDTAGNRGATELPLTLAEPISIAFTDLVDGQTVSGMVPIETTIDTLAGLAQLQLAIDGETVATASDPPFALEWDTTTVENGPHELSVTAVDLAGLAVREDLSLHVGPRIVVPDLTPGDTVGGIVPLRPVLDAPGAITEVNYILDGETIATRTADDPAFDWDTSELRLGDYVLALQLADDLGNETMLELPLSVKRPVSVAFINPPESDWEALSGDVFIEVDAEALAGMDRVEFSVDDEIVATAQTLPYAFTWSTSGEATGRHTVTATAYDLNGLSESTTREAWLAFRGANFGLAAAVIILLLAAGILLPLAARRRRQNTAAPAAQSAMQVAGAESAAPSIGKLNEGATADQQVPVAWLENNESGVKAPLYPGDTSLGRKQSANDIMIPSSKASRQHSVIRVEGSSCTYYDLQPTNPTLINGQPVVGLRTLDEGDQIQIGDIVLRFSRHDR